MQHVVIAERLACETHHGRVSLLHAPYLSTYDYISGVARRVAAPDDSAEGPFIYSRREERAARSGDGARAKWIDHANN